MTLQLDAEPVSFRGGIAGDGVLNVLSKPALGFWDVFLRETLQNSNDARLDVDVPVRFTVEWMHAEGSTLGAFRDDVFSDLPPDHPLESLLTASSLPILIVADQGTSGLGGPIDPTIELGPDETADFASFVYNIGRDPERAPGGGTYGFGKSILYLASAAGTVLIYSQTMIDRDTVEPRLIVASLGARYSADGKKYTGRHWWGVLDSDDDHAARPLVGEPARALAERLGLLRLEPEETGTTLAVLAPDLESVSQELPEDQTAIAALFSELRSAVLKWCWPHLVDLGGGASIQFRFIIDGEVLPPPRIDEHNDLPYFVDAYREAMNLQAGGQPTTDYTLKSWKLPLNGKPFQTGTLVRRRSLIPGDGELRDHIALMRTPQLIVEYRPVTADPNGLFAVGVFVATEKANKIFADREPSTHDAWHNEDGRGGADVRPVWRTNLDIQKAMREDVTKAPAPQGDESPPSGLEQLAEELAAQLNGLPLVGPGPSTPKPPKPPRPRPGPGAARARVEVSGLPRFVELMDGWVVADFPLQVTVPRDVDASGWSVTAEPRVALDDGTEPADSLPEFGRPTVVGWGVRGAVGTFGPEATLATLIDDAPIVRVKHPKEVAVEIRLTTGVAS